MRSTRVPLVLLVTALAVLAGLTAAVSKRAGAPAGLDSSDLARARAAIRAEALRAHVRFLADDLLRGRAPGTHGYDVAAAYVASQFESLGLSPGGTDGWYQPVPFVASTIQPAACAAAVIRGGAEKALAWGDDFVTYGDVLREASTVDAEVVFAGFGVTAPEVDYDDYAGLDARGKIVVYCSGAPARFPNDQRAYHSLSTRKRALAARHGAVGVITIRTPKDQGRSPWASLLRRVTGPNLSRLGAGGKPTDVEPALKISLALSPAGTEALFAGAPRPLADVYARAEASNPPRFPLGARVRVTTASRHRRMTSPNVIGRLQGSDPRLASECVVYTAHLDHLGVTAPVKGDSINNGAYDNGTGIAALIEVARAFQALPKAPRRSILFLATTAEEQGMEGSYYYADTPTVPIERIVANVNMDMFLMLHPLKNVIAYGAEHSTLGPVTEDVLRGLGLAIVPDPAPEEVIFIRSDQIAFVRKGVPAIFLDAGPGTGNPRIDGEALERAWRRSVYHSPQDDASQKMDWSGGVTWTTANFLIGLRVANDDARPTWNAGDFFGATFGKGRVARR